ncbi:Alpha/Beta hydrolase protein [Melanogaster broomeanus]|nr:Alpha/Beta hydrolase protein [Melanogaster broomeanus]
MSRWDGPEEKIVQLYLVNDIFADPFGEFSPPTVTLDMATVTGVASGSVNQFLGIPFAQPPTGNLRFQLPNALPPYNTSFSATAYGPACSQQTPNISIVSVLGDDALHYLAEMMFNVTIPPAEDCLTLNVVAPADATPESKLPVVVWIYGGAFEIGSTEQYNGSVIVETAISYGVPAIYVTFGFLASQEVKDAGVGNLGLHDQRLALYWVQKYIGAFGGDPTKVTIWGESAGAMVTNGGNSDGLFRAAFMQSGSPFFVGDIAHGQKYYDALCLREVPYDLLLQAVNLSPSIFSYQSMVLAWMPRVDGIFLTDDPQYLVQQGSVVDVPFVTGRSPISCVCDDEGTLFSFTTLNITTDTQLEEWIQTYWVPDATSTVVQEILRHYPADITQGSPFDTGTLNALTPQFKRIAAFQGDIVFQAPRRFFLQQRSGKQNLWTYSNKRRKTVPSLGSFHGSDFLIVYRGEDLAAYLVRFVANLDPNGDSDLYWPQYTTAEPNMLELLDGVIPQALTQDTYRAEAIEYLINVTLEYPL